jgi:aminoglycoside phosphotransferase (APT) family kinase protein
MTNTLPALIDCIDDPAIPTLHAVLDPAALREHLFRSLPSQAMGVEQLQVYPLRHHVGKRCVVEITMQMRQGSLALIGKVYAKDRSDVYKVMEEISRAGFGPSEEFRIPQPTAYLQSLQLLLQQKVEGRPATESFLSDDESDREAAAERCAHWLARFHAIAPPLGPSFELGTYLVLLEQWFHRLALLGEPFADKARTLYKRLEATASELQRTERCTIHGDFSHHQVIFGQNSTVTVDLDNYKLADPARDLAHFMVGLKRLALRCLGSIKALDDPAEIFLSTYAAAHRSDRTTQLGFQKAAICLEHAKHDVHKRASGWRETAEVTLDEGLRILEVGA